MLTIVQFECCSGVSGFPESSCVLNIGLLGPRCIVTSGLLAEADRYSNLKATVVIHEASNHFENQSGSLGGVQAGWLAAACPHNMEG